MTKNVFEECGLSDNFAPMNGGTERFAPVVNE